MKIRYFVKDYADGWIECENAYEAGKLAAEMGSAVIRVSDLGFPCEAAALEDKP